MGNTYLKGALSLLFHPHNNPHESLELQILTYLHSRMNLSHEDQQNYHNLRKGHLGELNFYDFMQEKLKNNCIQLYSLLLEENNNAFQIDALYITQNTIYLFEVKNFEGDFYIKGDQWYAVTSRKEIRNPVHQLKRTELLLRQLLLKLDFHHMKIESFVVFINPEFTLYQAPLNLPFILPTQLHRLAKRLNSMSTSINAGHTKLARQLISAQADPTPYMKLPKYNFSQLKKGIVCSVCSEFLSYFNRNTLVCQHCGSIENIESAIIQSVKEFSLLFPEERITTTMIHEWCRVIKSKKAIRRILQKNLKQRGGKKFSYFTY